MRAVAIVVTCGRVELMQLLAMWARQSVPVPLLVWLDDAPHVRVCDVPDTFHVHHAPRIGGPLDVGAARNAAVAYARALFGLREDDAFIVLDDDDYYARDHAERTLRVLALGAAWTGARRIGVQRNLDAPVLVESDDGPGQHAAWAMRLGLFDSAGGYPLGPCEDVNLANAIGWPRCTPHWHLTHVRRSSSGSLSAHGCDRNGARIAANEALQRALPSLEGYYPSSGFVDFRPAISGEIVAIDAWVAETERRHDSPLARSFR